jgi:hypothetical protein
MSRPSWWKKAEPAESRNSQRCPDAPERVNTDDALGRHYTYLSAPCTVLN